MYCQKAVIFFVAVIFFSFTSKSQAQNIPPGAEPGAEAGRYQSEVERENKKFKQKKIKAPEIKIEKEEEKPEAEGLSFVLKEVRITGVTIFEPEDLRFTYEAYLNKSVKFKDLEEIASKIKFKYKEKGYFTTSVFVPEQKITGGKVEIRVLEGKMGELNVEGAKWFSADLIKKFFHSKKNAILNIRTVERDIMRLNQTTDLEVKVVISQGREPGTSDIALKVKDRIPYHINLSLDNQGTRLTGKNRDSFGARSTNLTGNFDSLFVNTLFSTGTFGQSLYYVLPVGTYGTEFGFDATYFSSRIGEEYEDFDITGVTQIYSPRLSWELYLSEDFQADANLGIDIKAIKKRTGSTVTSNDQLRMPYFSFGFTKSDSFFGGGQTFFGPKFTFSAANFLGASSRNHDTASRQGTGGFFFKFAGLLMRIQRMPFDSYAVINSQIQLASHTLPSSEQIQIGGLDSVRGYPEGEYLADAGGNINFDWVLPMYLIPKDWKLPNSDRSLRHQIEPVFFFAAGGGSLKKVLPGEERNRMLLGFGGGLRINLFKATSLRLEWAGHMGGNRPIGGSGPSTFYFTFQSEI